MDKTNADADMRAAAIKRNVSPFLKNVLATIGIGVNTAATGLDNFAANNRSLVKDFGAGKYRVTPADVGEGMKKTGIGLLNLTGALAQGFNEGIIRIGTSVADASLPGYKEKRQASNKSALATITGKEEMRSYQEIFSGADQWAKEKGATETGAKFFAGFGAMGAIFLDQPGIGSGAKGVLKIGKRAVDQLAATTDEKVIQEIVRAANPNLSDEAVEFMTPVFREAQTAEEVNTALRVINGSAKTIAKNAEKTRIVDEGKEAARLEADPLVADARKYKTADDFVKARGEPVYHGSPDGMVDEFEIPKRDGIYFTKDRTYAESFTKKATDGEKGAITEAYLDIKNPKIFDGNDPVQFKAFTERGIDIEDLKKKGHDAAVLRFKDGKDDIMVLEPEKVRTRAQLERIYESATRPGASPIEVASMPIPRTAPIPVNLTKNLGAAKDPYEILSILKNEYPHLPDRVVDRMVSRFVRTRRVKNVENLIRAARNLNEQFKPGGSIRSAAPAAARAAAEPKAIAEVLEKTVPKGARKFMSQPQKEAMIRTLKDQFENPKDAVAAQHEYNRIWDDLNQQIVDDYENLTLQKSFLEDVLSADSEGISGIWKRLFTGPNKKNAVDDSVMELAEIQARAMQKKKAIENYRKHGVSGDKKFPGNPGKLTKTEEFAARLDQYLVDAGIPDGDFDIAQEAIERYARTRAEVLRIGEQLKEMKPRVREARILQEGLDDIAIIPQKDVEVIDRIVTKANVRDRFTDIANLTTGTRDVYRNFEKFFGTQFAAIKKAVLDPFDASKGLRVDEVKKLGDELEEGVVGKFGIRRGSKESAAIQRYGDPDLDAGLKLDREGLVKEFGKKKAEDIIAADAWFRKEYERLIDELNEVRKKIYPRNPAKLIAKRKNYYRHYEEMAEGFGDALREFFDTPSGISPGLVGTSEFTKPKTRWLSFAQERLGKKTELDAVGGFMQYSELFAYAKHIDPHVSRFRYLQRKIAEVAPIKGEELTLPDGTKFKAKGAESFLGFLDDFTRDLTGNTSPMDRWVQKRIPGGRATIRAGRFINNRMKANSVLGNFGTMVAQVANVPAGIADTKLYAAVGMKRAIASIFVRNEPMMQSSFLKERYQKYLTERFPFQFKDRPVRATGDLAVKQAAWLMGKADEMGTKFIWNAQYAKAVAQKSEDPIKFADDKTRKLVAGRGIGEVPIDQKALVTQFGAPFTLEVGNAIWIMKDWISEKNYSALMTFFVANYLFNEAAERTRGSRVVFDPINSLIEGSLSLAEEWKEGNPARGWEKFAGRQAGEVLANIPFGQTVAAAVPDSMVQAATKATTGAPMTKRDIFGNSTAGRFGTPLLLTGLQDAVFRLLPRVGGLQLKKTYQGIKALIAGHAEDKAGDETFKVPMKATNVVRALLFGAGATSEARKYFDERQDLFDAKSRSDAEGFVRGAAAEDSYAKFKKLLADGKGPQAADYLAAESAKDPLFAKALVQVIKDEKAGLNPNDRMLKMLGVENGERAKYIAGQLEKIDSGDARADYLADLTEKKILTVDVAKQLALFMAK